MQQRVDNMKKIMAFVIATLDCDSVRTMKEKNKIEFYSIEEANEKNYKPCSRCKPHYLFWEICLRKVIFLLQLLP